MQASITTPEPELNDTFAYILDYWPVLTQEGHSLATILARVVVAAQSRTGEMGRGEPIMMILLGSSTHSTSQPRRVIHVRIDLVNGGSEKGRLRARPATG